MQSSPGASARLTGHAGALRTLFALGTAIVVAGVPAAVAEAGPVEARPLIVAPGGAAGFSRVPPAESGVTFTNRLSDEAAAENQIRLNGSGVALGDVDGDGRVDLFFCGLESPNQLFRNLGGWRFEAVSLGAAVALPGRFCTGAVFADVDGDGDSDLLVGVLGEGVRLLANDGHGAFIEKTDAGLARSGGPTTLALGDVEGDGDLDLYVANYRTTTIRSTGFPLLNIGGGRRVLPPEFREQLEWTAEGRILEHGEPDALYLNDGTGRFEAVSWTDGRFLDETGAPLGSPPRDWTLTAAFRDLNQDGAPDLYACGDFHSPDRIWLNDGHGRFFPPPTLSVRHSSTFTMSVEFADFDRDGWDDFLLLDMLDGRRRWRMVQFNATEPHRSAPGQFEDRPQYSRNMLHRNRGDGTYAEVAYFAGLEATGWSWSAVGLDVDLDGFEDVLLARGNLFDPQDVDAAAAIDRLGPLRRDQIPGKLLRFPRLPLPLAAYRNLGGLRFEDVSKSWGFDEEGVAQGMALGDLDGDGDLDLVVNALNAAAGLYRNNASGQRIAVRLQGAQGNTSGVGARISLVAGGITQAQELSAGGRYLSGDAPSRTFAWPKDSSDPAELRIAWHGGQVTTLKGVHPDHLYVVREPEVTASLRPNPAARRPLRPETRSQFVDVSNAIGHRHVETPFDDFQRQPLLPRRLSQSGPGAVWLDLDDDGWDDLVIGAGKGGTLGLFRNDQHGGFAPLGDGLARPPAARDVTGMVRDPLNPRGLLMALSNAEEPDRDRFTLQRLDPVSGAAAMELLPDLASTAGPLAVADADGDGDLDVFVAGRSLPGRYPEPARSVLLRQQEGVLAVDAASGELLDAVGLVTGALWSDLNLDGIPELVLACEWGSLRIFRHDRGRLVSWNPPVDTWEGSGFGGRVGLESLTGWWTTVVSGDFDGDGRPDLLAGNWGLNTRYRATPQHPLRLYYGDFDQSGSLDLIEAHFDAQLGAEFPDRDLMALRLAVPGLVARFPTHAAYAQSTVSDLLGNAFARTPFVQAATLASLVLLNRGDHWTAAPLPDEAQWSPVQAAVAGDFDGDGDVDAFLAQNFFAVEPTTSRDDAGRGLLLSNDGHGRFRAVDASESGVFVYGEQRGCAATDFNHDGRLDLVVTQNAAPTRLFRNATARPGLRVRVRGPAANPQGIGSAVRLREGDRRGPAHEIQAGSGGLCQNGLAAHLAAPTGPAVLEVRWPGGAVTKTAVMPGAGEVAVEP